MTATGPIAQAMRAKLEAAFRPSLLVLRDDSEKHRGHGGWREGGESHFHLRIRAAAFNGLGRLARQRLVMDCLRAELAGPVHALSMEVLAEIEEIQP